MTQSNHKTPNSEGKDNKTVVTINEKDLSKRPEENDLESDDRQNLEKLKALDLQKKRSSDEEKELEQVKDKVVTKYMITTGGLPEFFADTDLKPYVRRIHKELSSQYVLDTPLKRILVNRVTSAWSMAYSYERMLKMAKYEETEDGKYSWKFSHERTCYLKEIRRGIESANDQILRLTQALQNISNPPMQVKVKNAVFAQNMQINQGVAPKDFDNISEKNNNEKTTP